MAGSSFGRERVNNYFLKETMEYFPVIRREKGAVL
jgi:hypothetical protein